MRYPRAVDGLQDRELMGEVRGGSREAYEALVAGWGPRIFAFLLRRTGSRFAAEEAYQETWLRVWQWRARYDPARAFRPWLFTIASNAGFDSRKPRRDDFELAEEPGVDRDPVPARDSLLKALHALSPADRRLVLLAGEGFNATEIGAMEALKPGTVRMRLKRARERMAAAISSPGVTPGPAGQ